MVREGNVYIKEDSLYPKMAKKENGAPEHIKEFYRKHDQMRKLLDTTEAVHAEAYHKGLESIRDKKGQVDYQMLEEVKNQDKFLDKMVDHYLSSAVQRMGLKEKPKDAFDQDVLLQQYIGVTRGQLRNFMRKAKSKYTLQRHEGLRGELMKKQEQSLVPLRSNHFEDEHKEDILKYVGAHEYIAKDNVDVSDLTGLLELHRERGEVTLADLDFLASTPEEKGGWGSDLYLTSKAKEEIKKKKEKGKKAAA